MYQMGGEYHRRWSQAMGELLSTSQRQDGAFKGSWDPIGPWGFSGGRVYSTACMLLCAQAHYRSAQLLGTR